MHIPVLPKETIDFLDTRPGENFIDCTLHEGGHADLILEKIENGKVLGIEIDKEVSEKAKDKYKNDKRVMVINDSYSNLENIVKKNDFKNVSGILLDIGISSWHIDESKKGFSFQKDEPLDMRFGQGKSAEEILNTYSERELEKIFKEYGEERFSKKIAKAIAQNRNIKTTMDLVKIIKKSVPADPKVFARIFQAIRIEANRELDNLESVLPQALEILDKGGRLVVISFHSLEDRIVKQFINKNKDKVRIINKKPARPTVEELSVNPRARSAKLRAVIKI